MNKAFEKILDRLDSHIEDAKSEGDFSYIKPFEIAKIAVREAAEEYNGGWIPCIERFPEEYGEYLVWWTDITGKQYYEITEYEPENGWIGDIPQAVEGKYNVIAWQPLPENYKEENKNEE